MLLKVVLGSTNYTNKWMAYIHSRRISLKICLHMLNNSSAHIYKTYYMLFFCIEFVTDEFIRNIEYGRKKRKEEKK